MCEVNSIMPDLGGHVVVAMMPSSEFQFTSQPFEFYHQTKSTLPPSLIGSMAPVGPLAFGLVEAGSQRLDWVMLPSGCGGVFGSSVERLIWVTGCSSWHGWYRHNPWAWKYLNGLLIGLWFEPSIIEMNSRIGRSAPTLLDNIFDAVKKNVQLCANIWYIIHEAKAVGRPWAKELGSIQKCYWYNKCCTDNAYSAFLIWAHLRFNKDNRNRSFCSKYFFWGLYKKSVSSDIIKGIYETSNFASKVRLAI